ncbi:heme exporter protein CcmB [Terricaulis sp.]|uniref:heme exporter protein CcmB n=1 Tax=Terricaulis sp. TaxID=2768686 RepID=UPI0037832468
MSAFGASFRRDFAQMWGAGGGALAPVGFFFGAATLVPLAMGNDPTMLAKSGPPLMWIAAALAVLATLERLFQADLEDGSLDQMLLSPAPLEVLVFAKGLALWCAVGVPLALASAPTAIALQADPALVPAVAASVALGMAAFIAVGLVGAAVTAGVKRAGVLIAIIVLPFFAPPIIFGAIVAHAGFGGEFAILWGITLGYVALSPIAAAAALRLQAE